MCAAVESSVRGGIALSVLSPETTRERERDRDREIKDIQNPPMQLPLPRSGWQSGWDKVSAVLGAGGGRHAQNGVGDGRGRGDDAMSDERATLWRPVGLGRWRRNGQRGGGTFFICPRMPSLTHTVLWPHREGGYNLVREHILGREHILVREHILHRPHSLFTLPPLPAAVLMTRRQLCNYSSLVSRVSKGPGGEEEGEEAQDQDVEYAECLRQLARSTQVAARAWDKAPIL
jgi:hypothetical protein